MYRAIVPTSVGISVFLFSVVTDPLSLSFPKRSVIISFSHIYFGASPCVSGMHSKPPHHPKYLYMTASRGVMLANKFCLMTPCIEVCFIVETNKPTCTPYPISNLSWESRRFVGNSSAPTSHHSTHQKRFLGQKSDANNPQKNFLVFTAFAHSTANTTQISLYSSFTSEQ